MSRTGDMMLSIIMPIACSDTQLNSVVMRLIQENQTFIKDNPCELILMDSKPNPRGREELDSLIETSKDYGVPISYYETTTVGVGAKFREGLALAEGKYAFFMVDELVSTYDFLADAYVIAQDQGVCSVPYMESRDPETSTFPLSYPKYAPIAPISFPLMRKDLFVELAREMPSHWLGTLHWSLLCAKSGIKVAFSSRHLYYCPLVKADVFRPPVYRPIGMDVRSRDEQKFRNSWDIEGCARAHSSMLDTLKSVVNTVGSDGAHVVIGPNDGLFLVRESGGVPIKPEYLEVNSVDEIDREGKRLLGNWQNSIQTDAKIARLFLSNDNSRKFPSIKRTMGKFLNCFFRNRL
jgi:hypothetical protein